MSINRMAQAEFWRSFVAESDDLARRLRDGESRAVFDRVVAILTASGIEWCIDITSDGTHGHLIFTPEGSHELASQIDAFLDGAPALTKWKLFGGRQRKALDDVRAIILDFYYLDPCDCSYHIIYDGDTRTVQMSLPDDPNDMTDAEKSGLINTFLWHAVGERFVMDNDIRGEVLVAAEHCTLSVHDMITELIRVKSD